MLVIDPDECIDCTLCVAECPVEAIFAEDDGPDAQREFMQAPVGGRDCGLGFTQLVGGVVLVFLGGRHVPAQSLDAPLKILQFVPFRIDAGGEGGRKEKDRREK